MRKNIIEAGVLAGDGLMRKIRRAFVHFTVETEVVLLKARPGSRGRRLH